MDLKEALNHLNRLITILKTHGGFEEFEDDLYSLLDAIDGEIEEEQRADNY